MFAVTADKRWIGKRGHDALARQWHQKAYPAKSPRAAGSGAARDTITFGIAVAAIVLFVGTGGVAMPLIVESLRGQGHGPGTLQVCALLLNVALILFGWKRCRQLAYDIQVHQQGEAEALQLAKFDALTGFLNRRSLTEAAERLILEARERGEAVAIVMADLDSFKQVNDHYGHGAGDLVLQECAKRITQVLPDRSVPARIGGDEFVCLVPFDLAHPQRIDELASRLIVAMAAPSPATDAIDGVTVSIGIARSDDAMPAGDEQRGIPALLHAADIAMYHAKRQGRNRHCWYEPAMENELRVRRELETSIRRGIPLGEFVPYYEQQVDLGSGRLTGFEMLARWNSPIFGIVGPQVFIPIAEEIGVIGLLSESLIAQALRDAKAWDPQLTLSVNISPVQLRDPWFSQKLLKLLVEANFPPKRLEIEITESILLDNIGSVRTLLASLKNQGIRISLDDFGTGYSSLSQLSELPIDCIKIDRSFIMQLTENKDSAAIVKMITSLGKGLGLPIIAEGIESEEVLNELRGFGDFKGQGYLYGQPETASQTTTRLAALDLLAQNTAQPIAAVKPQKRKPRRAQAKRAATG